MSPPALVLTVTAEIFQRLVDGRVLQQSQQTLTIVVLPVSF